MTKEQIHIRSILRKKGYRYDQRLNHFDKTNWKNVGEDKKLYLHVVIYIDYQKKTYSPIFFTHPSFKRTEELEKYYIVFNRVKGDMAEIGFKQKV